MGDRDFKQGLLLERVAGLPGRGTLLVAFSGGCDSHVLLHALAALRPELDRPIAAVHVDHGLRPESGRWAQHCAEVCAGMGVDLHLEAVDAGAPPGVSPEAAARRARYAALRDRVRAGDVLLTAHHADDQAETVLLQLLRGSGPRGLAAMPALREFGLALHARPLLELSRAALHRYALCAGLVSVHDPSNSDLRVDRSYLREIVMPSVRERWPGVAKTLARVARHQARLAALEETCARADLETVRGAATRGRLDAEALARLPPERRGSALRAWIVGLGLPSPSMAQIERVLDEVVSAAPDRVPRIAWPGGEVRRYRGELWALSAPVAFGTGASHGARARIAWRPPEPVVLPAGRLTVERARGRGLSVTRCAAGSLEISFRAGGERCRPAPGARTRTVKNLFREWGIPPWERGLVPLVLAGDELVAIADRCVCAGWEAGADEAGWILHWERRQAQD